jgi:leucyl-tRNA synthetase
LKFGFYELQTARDWYREVTADIGMHAELVRYWIRVSALLVTPIAPHFTEHIWSSLLQEPKSIQLALWPHPPHPVDKAIVDSGVYMRNTVKTIRDAELSILKKMQKGKKPRDGGDAPFDPKKPKSVRIYVATTFPEWQDACVQAAKDAYEEETDKIDDAKVRELLMERGLIKDKRAMPFIQLFKVNDQTSGSDNIGLTAVYRSEWLNLELQQRSDGPFRSRRRLFWQKSCPISSGP